MYKESITHSHQDDFETGDYRDNKKTYSIKTGAMSVKHLPDYTLWTTVCETKGNLAQVNEGMTPRLCIWFNSWMQNMCEQLEFVKAQCLGICWPDVLIHVLKKNIPGTQQSEAGNDLSTLTMVGFNHTSVPPFIHFNHCAAIFKCHEIWRSCNIRCVQW